MPPADSGEILIVEDSRTQAEQLCYLLERLGYAARSVASGVQALAAIRQHRPKLMLCDILMPEMNGYDLCQLIKGVPEWQDIPVVLLTSLTWRTSFYIGTRCGRLPLQTLRRAFSVRPHRAITAEPPVPPRHRTDKQSTTLSIRGEQRTVHAEPQQLLDFLVSIYQQAIQLNKELGRQNRAGIDQNR